MTKYELKLNKRLQKKLAQFGLVNTNTVDTNDHSILELLKQIDTKIKQYEKYNWFKRLYYRSRIKSMRERFCTIFLYNLASQSNIVMTEMNQAYNQLQYHQSHLPQSSVFSSYNFNQYRQDHVMLQSYSRVFDNNTRTVSKFLFGTKPRKLTLAEIFAQKLQKRHKALSRKIKNVNNIQQFEPHIRRFEVEICNLNDKYKKIALANYHNLLHEKSEHSEMDSAALVCEQIEMNKIYLEYVEEAESYRRKFELSKYEMPSLTERDLTAFATLLEKIVSKCMLTFTPMLSRELNDMPIEKAEQRCEELHKERIEPFKRQYHALMLRYAPDRNKGNETEANQVTQEINKMKGEFDKRIQNLVSITRSEIRIRKLKTEEEKIDKKIAKYRREQLAEDAEYERQKKAEQEAKLAELKTKGEMAVKRIEDESVQEIAEMQAKTAKDIAEMKAKSEAELAPLREQVKSIGKQLKDMENKAVEAIGRQEKADAKLIELELQLKKISSALKKQGVDTDMLMNDKQQFDCSKVSSSRFFQNKISNSVFNQDSFSQLPVETREFV